jgi:DNA-binding MarR family transcriptional regulator
MMHQLFPYDGDMGTTRWLDDREQGVWRAFIQVHARLFACLARQLQRDTGLSEGDYEVLVNLSEAPEQRLRSFELSAAIQWEKSRLSHHLTRMQGRGLVDRQECPTDGRGAFVVLTAAGREAIEAAAPLHVAEVRRLFLDTLTAEQLDALGEISQALRRGLDATDCG